MINILLAGVGGQGTVLAAKVLAKAAQSKGWQVRTAETIGMAQRGGSVTSHVRMGSDGEAVQAPLVTKGTADVVIAFEPGEAARALLYLAPEGVLVTATSAIQPVTAALAGAPYNGEAVVSALQQSVAGSTVRFVPVDDQALVAAAGNRKALNMMLLAVAVAQNRIPLTIDELKAAVAACVKPQFVTMNLKAIDEAVASA
ncbi:MAG: pyruvate ferredoxin oxidoreductase [Eggerthellaceae bacterium]|nr:pyruvate ferredoxin oxidoreductase [Eggerthellaceae bacterium]